MLTVLLLSVLTTLPAITEPPATTPTAPTPTAPAAPSPATTPGAPASAPAAKPGQTIRGKVTISGTWDLQKPDVTRVVVSLASNPELDKVPPPEQAAVVVQKDKRFVPSFLAVSRGTTVEFPNWDDFDHNVFSRSKAAPAFDLDRYPKGESKSRMFDKVGVVQVFCNIHPQMRAIIVVTPNVFFARADADGAFTITGVPPGTYEIVAWHDRCGEKRQAVEVTPSGPAEVSLVLEESRGAIIENNAPRESDYGVERGLGVKRERLNLPVVKDSHPAPPGSDCIACPKPK